MNKLVAVLVVLNVVFIKFAKTSFVLTESLLPTSQVELAEQTETDFDAGIVSYVDAVLGRTATLPCDITPNSKEDRVYMVFWYKDGIEKPIYTFDARGRALSEAKSWSHPDIFGPRAYFVTISSPATLTLDGIQMQDKGIFRCRVDFKLGPTRNFAIKLNVIIPPHQLLIYDNSGQELNSVVGPMEEGSDLVLTCEVRGGEPSPTVSWFINDRMVEGQVDDINNNVFINRLTVPKVGRSHLNSTYKCQASNTKLMMPQEKTVRLELLLRPLKVSILSKPSKLISREEVTISCEVLGSRPKATVTWMTNNRVFRRGKMVEEGNDTITVSSVTFAPEPEDDNAFLKCVGDNPKLPGVELEDSFRLNVYYPPQVVLHLGSTLNPEGIKEGDDVYFECLIKSNPRHTKITWFHDGMVVSQNMSSGVIISSHSLVLQRVTRWQSGSYTCLAINPRGETVSTPVLLRVRYAPVCSKESEVTVIGASLDEVIKVRCQVSADPADVTFQWQFNNNGENFDVSSARFSKSSGNISELIYTPAQPRDYGTLTCWGSNSIGRQLEPCIFQVVPASKPAALSNCTLRNPNNQSVEIVEVECRAGYDGGLPQKFILEAYDARNMRLRLNLSTSDTETPVFHFDLSELMPPPPSLRILVYSMNAKGKSEKIILDDITLNDAEKHTDGSGGISLVPLAGLLTGSLLTLGLAVLVIVVIAIRRRRHNGQHCSHHMGIDASKHQPKSRQSSMLEINTGDNRYVVAYTLKPAADCGAPILPPPPITPPDLRRQPDILNTPRGGSAAAAAAAAIGNGANGGANTSPPGGNTMGQQQQQQQRPDALFPLTGDTARMQLNCNSPANLYSNNLQSSPIVGNETGATLGRSRPRPNNKDNNAFSSFATMRRDHIIADSIPGPESCV